MQEYANKMEKIMEDIVPKIRLDVFNSDSRKVKTLINEVKEAGTYKVEFKTNELESGEYLYKLETTDFFDAKKMIVL